MGGKAKDFFKNSIGYIAIFILCALYLSVSFITVSKTGKSALEIFADTAIAFVFGVSLNNLFEIQGMLDGDKDPRMIATSKLHADAIERIAPSIEELSDWCDEKNAAAMKMQRVRILAAQGMKYASCFDEDGVALPYQPKSYQLIDGLSWWQQLKERRRNKKSERDRYRAYEKAINLFLTPLTASVLTSEGGKADDPYYLGRTKLEFERVQTIRSVITRILVAFIFGYYGASLIENFRLENLIWVVLQIGLFTACGVISYYVAFVFITDEFRGRIVKKIDHLQAFENFINSKRRENNDRCNESQTEGYTEGHNEREADAIQPG